MEMIFEIRRIADPGDLDDERVVLKALGPGELGDFALFAARRSQDPGKVLSGRIRSAYWFPNRQLKTGDLAVLYTKSGRQSEKKLEGGSKTYFFYWGLEEPIWGDEHYKPVLVEVSDWGLAD